jgi:hypothetical protein
VNNFGQGEKNQIINKKNSVNCLSDPGPTPVPTIASVTPNAVPAFLPPSVTISGNNLSTTLKVTVGAVDVTASNGLISVGDSQVTFVPPTPVSLGSKSVTVTTLGGTSAPLGLSYTETNPPVLKDEFLGFTGEPYTWSWGAGANKTSWLVVAVNPQTALFQGQEILVNYIQVASVPLPGSGVASLTFNLPPAAIGLQFVSQVFTFNPLQVSNITSTWIPY